jgi:hypothetical protein
MKSKSKTYLKVKGKTNKESDTSFTMNQSKADAKEESSKASSEVNTISSQNKSLSMYQIVRLSRDILAQF